MGGCAYMVVLLRTQPHTCFRCSLLVSTGFLVGWMGRWMDGWMGRYLIPLLLDGWVLLIVIVMDVCGGRCIIDNEGRTFALPQG
jgi:hypothetical protein